MSNLAVCSSWIVIGGCGGLTGLGGDLRGPGTGGQAEAAAEEPDEPTFPSVRDSTSLPDPADTSCGAQAAPPTLVWQPGVPSGGRPALSSLAPLPGGAAGGPVLTSNNPEVFTEPGLLYGNARVSPTRGGQPVILTGDFGVYLHHLNRADRPLTVHLLVTNPNQSDVTVEIEGTGLDQSETGGLGLGASPDYHVSEDWILATPEVVDGATIAPFTPWSPWSRRLEPSVEVDGRFSVHSSAPVFVYVVVTETGDVNEAVVNVLFDAPGDYRTSGDPPPPFGRTAGVYAGDRWEGHARLDLPEGPSWAGMVVNTATGSGHPQVQAFPALGHSDGSASEAVGMYGNVYDLTVELRHDGHGSAPRGWKLKFGSLATAEVSRYWDGVVTVNGHTSDIRHTPVAPTTLLAEGAVGPGEADCVEIGAMVPGLTSIPQALWVEVE